MLADDLKEIFQSPTIKPTFGLIHVVLALMLFKSNPEGLGRYRLMEELQIGSGTARSLIKKLNEKTKFLTKTDINKRKGHILTEIGLKFVKRIEDKIPVVTKGDLSILKDITISSPNVFVYVCLIKNAAQKLKSGIEQRDAAIKIGGLGTTCMVYDGMKLVFPSNIFLKGYSDLIFVSDSVQKYFKEIFSKAGKNLENNDVVIIGMGEDDKKARLAAFNAVLTIV